MQVDKIQGILRDYSIKPSVHRIKILEYLLSNRTHPTVDKIYRKLAPQIPTFSKTTVYNTLTLFEEKGLVKSIAVPDNQLRYDLYEKPHAHFRCRQCNKIYDVPLNDIPYLEEEGFEVYSSQVFYSGSCKKCSS